MKLAFHDESSGLRGAIVNWVTGDEIPLARIGFDGSTLELQMEADKAAAIDRKVENPTLTMRLMDDQFEGYWMNSSGEKLGGLIARKLKMVRHRS